ncbi:hypothetical protein PYW08_009254 [Mythimna loreyi]|uniref:Uncharacterized protein n=1 Tax=Mythimna loreyi TaxID=667449 RepID=A0ACC2QC04_9NEOP|nr:hypothetical protein PYW08_009254 [Mythimna loreyi]
MESASVIFYQTKSKSTNMKAGLILLAVLAALVACNDAAVVQNAVSRANMHQGSYRPGDRLLHSGYYRKNPIYNAVQYQDITYRGASNVRITYLEAVEQGATQWAMPTLRAGGVGYNQATIRLTSARETVTVISKEKSKSANMKAGLFLLAVLAALVACNANEAPAFEDEAPGLQNAISRANMYQGTYRPGDRLLHSGYYSKNPIMNAVQYQDITYRGANNVRITYLEAVEQGVTQWGVPSLRAGGVGYNQATIRLTSARGYGYYYLGKNMKSFILVAVLAALTVCNDAASIPSEVTPFEDVVEFPLPVEEYTKDYHLEGATGRQLSDDDEFILFYEESFNLPPIANTEQMRDVVYLGNATTVINRIRVFNPPPVPGHTYIYNHRTTARVRVRSGPGQGLSCRVQFFGYYTD